MGQMVSISKKVLVSSWDEGEGENRAEDGGSERVMFKNGCHEGHELEYPKEKYKNC